MGKQVKKKKVCPKCKEPVYLVGNSIDESFKILTCKNKDCENYLRILKEKSGTDYQSEREGTEIPSSDLTDQT